MKRYLILEDGTVFPGEGFGSSIITTGQLVISNNRTGIEQSVTDPNSEGQIIVFTIPSSNFVSGSQPNSSRNLVESIA